MAVTVSPVVQNDWISLLPDEILHCILRRLRTSQQAAQTSALSKRWWNLWQSYPVVEFDYKSCNIRQSHTDNLESFVLATIRRFSRDSLQRVEKMNLYVAGYDDTVFPLVAELLNLASNRKAQEVCIIPSSRHSGYLDFPLESLSNSSLRSLRLGKMVLDRSRILSRLKITDKDDDLLPLNSLRSLHLWKVIISDERVLTDLFRSSPLLETLKLGKIDIEGLKKIRFSNFANLRTLTISSFGFNVDEIEEIEIVAPGLETLHLSDIPNVSRIDVTAPQLSHLEIDNHDLGFGYITAMISSNFPYLETLKLTTMTGMKKILVSKDAKLRTLTISCFGYSYDPNVVKVEEIEIVAPGLETLHLDDIRTVSRIDVTAPQLSHLEIGYYHDLSLGYIAAMISTNFPSLKSLKLYTYAYEWKLLRGPELVKFLL
ncbi:F-box/LRR-repeat protein 13, partial [Linum grandiflorum]